MCCMVEVSMPPLKCPFLLLRHLSQGERGLAQLPTAHVLRQFFRFNGIALHKSNRMLVALHLSPRANAVPLPKREEHGRMRYTMCSRSSWLGLELVHPRGTASPRWQDLVCYNSSSCYGT